MFSSLQAEINSDTQDMALTASDFLWQRPKASGSLNLRLIGKETTGKSKQDNGFKSCSDMKRHNWHQCFFNGEDVVKILQYVWVAQRPLL